MALQINDGISHQLPGHVVGDFTTTIQAMQGRRWMFWIEVQVVKAGTAAEGVASGMLQ